MFNKVIGYCKLCYEELAHHVTWPTQRELTHSAGVVLVASLVIAVLVFAMDQVFEHLMMFVYPN